MANDFTNKLERLELFEERAGVRLNALYARLAEGYCWTFNGKSESGIQINGELHPRDGTVLKGTVKVIADAYDELGRLICTASTRFDNKAFFGFETFSLMVGGVPANQITKVRVYPKLETY